MITRFRALPTSVSSTGVDRAAGIIRGASAIQGAVEALGKNMLIDSITLAQVADLGNRATGKGMKVRFTHPGMCQDGLGTMVGHATNFRVAGDRTVCDVAMDPVAKGSPHGDLYSYVLDLAESNPSDFGMSIVFSGVPCWKLSDGTEMPINDPSLARDGDGAYGGTTYVRPENAVGEKPFARVAKLSAVDFVDEAAANRDGLFRATLEHAFAATSSEAAEHAFAEIDAMLKRFGVGYDTAEQFAHRYLAARRATTTPTTKTPGTPMKITNETMLSLLKAHGDHNALIVQLAEGNAEEPTILAKIAEAKVAQATERTTALQAKITDLDTKLAAAASGLTAEQTAHATTKAQLAAANEQLTKLGKVKSETPKDVGGDAAKGLDGLVGEARWKAEFNASAELQEQFAIGGADSYCAFKRQEAKAKSKG